MEELQEKLTQAEETSEPASAEESEPESTTAAESAADDVTKPAEETEPVTEAPQESSEAVEETTEGIDVPTSAANDILDDEGADSQEVTTGTITENMSQAEVDAVVAENDVIVVEAGSYGIEDEKNHIKLTLTKGSQTVKLAGDYTRLMVVVLSEGNRIEADNAVINGEVDTVYNLFGLRHGGSHLHLIHMRQNLLVIRFALMIFQQDRRKLPQRNRQHHYSHQHNQLPDKGHLLFGAILRFFLRFHRIFLFIRHFDLLSIFDRSGPLMSDPPKPAGSEPFHPPEPDSRRPKPSLRPAAPAKEPVQTLHGSPSLA